jgi:hypothetical protein
MRLEIGFEGKTDPARSKMQEGSDKNVFEALQLFSSL